MVGRGCEEACERAGGSERRGGRTRTGEGGKKRKESNKRMTSKRLSRIFNCKGNMKWSVCKDKNEREGQKNNENAKDKKEERS